MLNIPLLPFETVRQAAETLTDPRVKSQLLSELAGHQLVTGQFDAALETFAAIPVPQERRIALLVADFQYFPPEKIEALVQLLKADPQTNSLAGRLALTMLETKNTDSAWKLVEIAEDAFESEEQRYHFLEQVLPLLPQNGWHDDGHKILRLYRKFAPGSYQDWALLAMAKYLVGQEQYEEAEKYAEFLVLPLRHSWTYWEMSQLSPAGQSDHYFDRAIEMIETVETASDEEEMLEVLAAQLRIYGRVAFQKGRKDLGERLLERSEAAAASLTVPMQRYRLQCFLGKVLVELKLIASIREYLAVDDMLESLRFGSDRSRVSVWLAEAGWEEGWTKSFEAVSAPERGVPEWERVQQLTRVLGRFVAHHQGLQATGDPSEDSMRISGEEFETRYFNPFAAADCGCY